MFSGLARNVLAKKKSSEKKGKKDKFLKNLKESDCGDGNPRFSSFLLSALFSGIR